MATKDDSDKDSKTKTGADRLREAEDYVKHPSKMDEFTSKREKNEKEAKEKAEAAKKNAPQPQPQPQPQPYRPLNPGQTQPPPAQPGQPGGLTTK